MEQSYLEKRRFKRLYFEEDGIVQLDKNTVQVTLLNISAKGALIKFLNKVSIRKHDTFDLSFYPVKSSMIIKCACEIIYCCNKLAGVMFVPITT